MDRNRTRSSARSQRFLSIAAWPALRAQPGLQQSLGCVSFRAGFSQRNDGIGPEREELLFSIEPLRLAEEFRAVQHCMRLQTAAVAHFSDAFGRFQAFDHSIRQCHLLVSLLVSEGANGLSARAVPTNLPTNGPDANGQHRTTANTGNEKAPLSRGLSIILGLCRIREWCPEEDSNLHTLSSTST